MINKDKISGLMNLAKSGNIFDSDMSGQLSATKGKITSLRSRLITLGRSDLANRLTGLQASGGGLDKLSSHVADTQSDMMNRMSVFSTSRGIKQMMGDTQQCSGIDESFGATLGSREVLTSVDDLQASIDELPSLQINLDQATAQLAQAQAKLDSGTITQDAFNHVKEQQEEAQAQLDSANQTLDDSVSTIQTTLGDVDGLIARENAAVDSAMTQIDEFTSSLRLNSMFNDPCLKNVLGAVGSSDLLGTLAIPDSDANFSIPEIGSSDYFPNDITTA